MKLIVVDDEVASLGTFLYNIVDEEDVNYQMFQHNPLKSLEYTRNNNIAAAFLDIHMPEINGIELAKMLVLENPQIKIIFISGYAQNEEAIANELKENLLGFCYKPYSKEILKKYIADIKSNFKMSEVNIVTFGGFDVFCNDEPVIFSSSKSKELLALLVDRRGMFVEMGEVIACLWEDKDSTLGKRLYRDAVFRLRRTLNVYNITNIVNIQRAKLAINRDNIECDLWTYLKTCEGAYSGNYMQNYGWSLQTQSVLDEYAEKFKNNNKN